MDFELEELTHENYPLVRQIERSDVPENFVNTVDTIMRLTDYAVERGIPGHTFAVKRHGAYIGLILLGEAIHWETDPPQMPERPFYRLMGFVLDRKYRGLGIGGRVLEQTIERVYRDFGPRPIALGCHQRNVSAARFYVRHGFRKTEYLETEDYYYLRYPEGEDPEAAAEGPAGSGPVTDIHTHVIPGVDDGARDLAEALDMLRGSLNEGLGALVATPHSFAFDYRPERTKAAYERLKQAAEAEKIPIRLAFGCEVLMYPETAEDCVEKLISGQYPTMGGSRYAMIEFDPWGFTQQDAEFCVAKTLDAGFMPIVAHVERYRFTTVDGVRALRDAGAKMQINAYSIVNEHAAWIRDSANALLAERLVDFMGTDSHRMTHRPPTAAEGLAAFARLYGEDYARQVCVENPRVLLTGEAEP